MQTHTHKYTHSCNRLLRIIIPQHGEIQNKLSHSANSPSDDQDWTRMCGFTSYWVRVVRMEDWWLGITVQNIWSEARDLKPGIKREKPSSWFQIPRMRGTDQSEAVTLARVPGLIAPFVAFWFLQVFTSIVVVYVVIFSLCCFCVTYCCLFIKCLSDAGDWLEGQIWRCDLFPQSAARFGRMGLLGNVILANRVKESFWHTVSAGNPKYEMRKRRRMWKRNLADVIFTYTVPFDLFSWSSSALHLSPLCSFILWTDRTGCILTQSSWKCQRSNRKTPLSPVHRFSVREIK